MIDLRKIIGYSNPKFPALDPTTPYYEFLSYCECCRSLDRPIKIGSFMRYQSYLKSIDIS
jgi:hypothetical protein